MRTFAVVISGILLTLLPAQGQTCVSLTTLDAPVTQNFDSLASSGTTSEVMPAGWYFSETGTNANTNYAIGAGGSNAGNTYSFGATDSTERALGGLQSGSLIPTFGACFTNDTGAAITQLDIAYTGEQWRYGGRTGTPTPVDRLDFQYSTNATSLTTGAWLTVSPLGFSSPNVTGTAGARDGNAAVNRTAVSGSVTVSVPAGATVWIRWSDFNVSGSDDGLAVDDFSLTSRNTGGPPPCVPTHAYIGDLQGAGSVSAFDGQAVAVQGVVTALKSNGFFLQDSGDGLAATSDAIFIYTAAAPGVPVGARICVAGTLSEYASAPLLQHLTEIGSLTALETWATDQPLPAPLNLAADGTPPDLFERFESMRVFVPALTVTGPTETYRSEFFGVLAGTPAPRREPGISITVAPPAGAPAGVPRFDANPEVLMVWPTAQPSAPVIDVSAGQTVANLTGVLEVETDADGNRLYTLLPDPAPAPTISPAPSYTAVRAPLGAELTVGSFNLLNFSDTDPASTRVRKAALAIRLAMQSPDIVGAEEIGSQAALDAIATRLNLDTVAAGQPDPQYRAWVLQSASINCGVLVKTSRVTVADVSLLDVGSFINPDDGLPDPLNDRQTLVARVTVRRDGSDTPLAATVLVNHLLSLINVDTDNRRRYKRRAQAEFLANELQARNAAGEAVVSVGDYNAFEFNDGYVDVMGTIVGAPAPADQVVLASSDLVNPDYVNLTTLNPAAYSYREAGNLQTLDHVLVNPRLNARGAGLEYAHNNADFRASLSADATRPERVSDHDMPVAYFTLPLEVTSRVRFVRGGFIYNRRTGEYLANVMLTNTSAEAIAGPVHIFFQGLSSNVTLKNATGSFDGAAYITVPGGIAPGQTVTVAVTFTNPTNGAINYTPRIYSINY